MLCEKHLIMANNLPYVDCHTHLDAIYEKMGLDLNEPFEKFSESWPVGFDGCLATFSDTFEGVMKFIDSGHPKIFGALGLHPHGASRYNDEFESQLIELLKNPRVKALGEIGLDYHYTLSPVDVQKKVFEREIQIAVERQLPITIHTREAEDDTFEILKRAMPKDHFFHIHCFTDSWEFAEKVNPALYPRSNSSNSKFFGYHGIDYWPFVIKKIKEYNKSAREKGVNFEEQFNSFMGYKLNNGQYLAMFAYLMQNYSQNEFSKESILEYFLKRKDFSTYESMTFDVLMEYLEKNIKEETVFRHFYNKFNNEGEYYKSAKLLSLWKKRYESIKRWISI